MTGNQMSWWKRATLVVLSLLPIDSIAFAAQAALKTGTLGPEGKDWVSVVPSRG